MAHKIAVRVQHASVTDALADISVLITGAAGMLGDAFARCLRRVAPLAEVRALRREELDVTDREQVRAVATLQPSVVVHCAGLADMDRCELDPELCTRSHVEGTQNVLELADLLGAKVIYPQSVFAFGDAAMTPLAEDAQLQPTSAYGRAKAEAEARVAQRGERALIIRMAGFFGGESRDKNFVGSFSRYLKQVTATEAHPVIGVGDRVWQPTFTEDLAMNTLHLLAHGGRGVYHMASHGQADFMEVATEIVHALDLADRVVLRPQSARSFSVREAARRPPRALLDNARLRAEGIDLQRPWRTALREYLARPYFQELAQLARIDCAG